MTLKLYVDPLSQPSRALMLFVRAAKIHVDEEIIISLYKGEQKAEEYKKVNKFQKVPAIVHNEFHMAESVAIFRYLAREFNVDDHWYPKTSTRGMARVDEYMSWQHLGLRWPLTRYILTIIMPERLSAIPPTPEYIAEAKKLMEDSVDNFEKLWLDGSDYVHGDQISVADLLAVEEIEMLKLADYDPREGRPQLTAYLSRVKADLGADIYEEVHQNMYKAAESFKNK